MKVAKFEQKIWVELKDHQKALEFARQAATLVEREECAKVCEALFEEKKIDDIYWGIPEAVEAIRARGLA